MKLLQNLSTMTNAETLLKQRLLRFNRVGMHLNDPPCLNATFANVQLFSIIIISYKMQ